MSDTHAPLGDGSQTAKDLSYSPASERETEERQKSPATSPATQDVDADAVETLPGTGGPDDSGAVVMDPDEFELPRDRGPH